MCKSLDKSKKCAIIKIRGNTGDGYSLKLAEITANSWKVWAVISFCFAYRLPTLQLQVRKYPVEEDLPKLCTSGITSLRRTRRKKKKFLRPPVREEATATGRQCLHPTKSAVCKRFLPCVCRNKAICALLLGVSKVTDFSVALLLYTLGGALSRPLSEIPLRRAFSLSAGVCLRGAVCRQIVPDTVSVAVPGVVTQTPSVPCAKVAAGTVIRPGTVANTPVVSL